MKKVLMASVLASAALLLNACGDSETAKKAREDVKQAAESVTEAAKETAAEVKEVSKETWDKTKEVSKETWDKTKEVSQEAWEKAASKPTVDTVEEQAEEAKEKNEKEFKMKEFVNASEPVVQQKKAVSINNYFERNIMRNNTKE